MTMSNYHCIVVSKAHELTGFTSPKKGCPDISCPLFKLDLKSRIKAVTEAVRMYITK